MPVGDDRDDRRRPSVLLVTKGLDLGGIERVVVDLALGLDARGVPVEVALVNPMRDRLVPPLVDGGITVHRLDGSDLIGVAASRRLGRLVRSGSFDVVHVHGPLPSVVVRLAAVRAAALVVTTSHTPWPSLRPATRATWRATAGLDAATVAVSSAVVASLPAKIGTRTTVIAHGIDPARIDAARAMVNGVDRDGPLTVVAVASHRDAKNYPNLLRAVSWAIDDGVDLRLVTIGDGPSVNVHTELARSLGIADAVEFMPATEDVLKHIARADLLVVASDYEGQPIVVAEALALGVPVVATAVGRVPELVDASIGRVVPPRDPVALGAALAELARDAELRAHMSATARTRPLRTLGNVIDAHIALYEQVVTAPR